MPQHLGETVYGSDSHILAAYPSSVGKHLITDEMTRARHEQLQEHAEWWPRAPHLGLFSKPPDVDIHTKLGTKTMDQGVLVHEAGGGS